MEHTKLNKIYILFDNIYKEELYGKRCKQNDSLKNKFQ